MGIELARRIDAEIISMDSMALYREMDIGTAKPSATEREIVPHHLIDVIEPNEEFSVAQYVEAADDAVRDIESRKRIALFVGGTPLYLKALLRGLFEGPEADWTLRRRLEEQAAEQGSEALHARLTEIDPSAAERLHPNDMRRIIRALEVFEKTGRPISQFQQQFDRARPAEQCHVFVLAWPRQMLHERIDRRVEQMFEQGLVDEVRRLLDQYGQLSRTAGQGLGYREVLEHLDQKTDLEETIHLVQTHTRQFAKRQETWFRSLSECQAIEMQDPLDVERVAEMIALSRNE